MELLFPKQADSSQNKGSDLVSIHMQVSVSEMYSMAYRICFKSWASRQAKHTAHSAVTWSNHLVRVLLAVRKRQGAAPWTTKKLQLVSEEWIPVAKRVKSEQWLAGDEYSSYNTKELLEVGTGDANCLACHSGMPRCSLSFSMSATKSQVVLSSKHP